MRRLSLSPPQPPPRKQNLRLLLLLMVLLPPAPQGAERRRLVRPIVVVSHENMVKNIREINKKMYAKAPIHPSVCARV